MVGGWWLPKYDWQSIKSAGKPNKNRPVVRGRTAWQYDLIHNAVNMCPYRRTAIDVGAHIGWWSFWLQGSFANVCAFEPVPVHYKCLTMNTERINIRCWNSAVGDDDKPLHMNVPEENSHNAHIVGGAVAVADEGIEVRCVPLDHFGFENVDLIKIDVEGYETAVIQGARATIKRNRPLIVIEQAGHEEKYGQQRDAAMNALKEYFGMVEVCDPVRSDYFLGWKEKHL